MEGDAASLEVTTLTEVYPALRKHGFLDECAFVLTPRNPAAASLVVAEQAGGEWQLDIRDGIGYEFMAGKDGRDSLGRDGYELLASLVRAVVTGRYRWEWREEQQRLMLRPWRRRTVPTWVGIFDTDSGVIAVRHYGVARGPESSRRRDYEPYVRSSRS